MLNNKYIKKLIKCHNHLVKHTSVLSNDLVVLDGGGQVFNTLDTCLTLLNGGANYNDPQYTLSDQKIADYCVNNIYRMANMSDSILRYFKVAQIFGKTSVDKYLNAKTGIRFYENKFLKQLGITRNDLYLLITDRDKHPLSKYVYPQYEERTKKRALNTNAGLYICNQSTLLWAPLSPTCQQCKFDDKCKQTLQNTHPELYRLRTEK